MSMRKGAARSPADISQLPEDELLEAVQRQTFGFFWEASHPLSGLAPDRCKTVAGPADDLVATGGSGFGLMALIVAVERGWIARAAAAERGSSVRASFGAAEASASACCWSRSR